MSSTENENKHKSYRLKYYYNKYVIVIVMFWLTCHVLDAAAAYVQNAESFENFDSIDFLNENVGCLWFMKKILSDFVSSDFSLI